MHLSPTLFVSILYSVHAIFLFFFFILQNITRSLKCSIHTYPEWKIKQKIALTIIISQFKSNWILAVTWKNINRWAKNEKKFAINFLINDKDMCSTLLKQLSLYFICSIQPPMAWGICFALFRGFTFLLCKLKNRLPNAS